MEELEPRAANSTPLTPLGFLERAATVYGDSASIVYNDTTYTWSQTHRRCLRLASSISSLGIKPGHVVSVISPNLPQMYELHFAVPMSGAVLNSVNTRLDARTISVLLRHCDSKLVFVDCLSRALLLDALSLFPPHTPLPLLVLITDGPEEDDRNRGTTSSMSSRSVQFCAEYEELVERGDPNFEWVRPRSEWDPIVLNYTSGTTSSPKGVVHCHRGIFIITVDSLIDWGVPKQPVYLWTLPMFHANGWSYPWGMAAVGGTNICLRKFDAPTIYEMIKKHNVTHICGAPVVLNMISNGATEPLKSPVESVLYGFPGINEAAVVARPDEFWGETPCAFVSLKESSAAKRPTEKEIIEYCRSKLPHYMVPRTVVFKDDLPKTSTGKIQKFVLREIARAMGPAGASRSRV
ncbi:hypothetical protein TIFTF001_009331 [Ficus carica]|uniref:AMP-dependent synthetase/ligase domain-containing protein n=1 Tax=Ficus carica TaxID=3494 RepID=A0AA87ZPQ6_FICCA|nr:hypothetical protein TIFTF001_009331 [Ficus carica]